MTTPISILIFGFVLGMLHATDADHVIAVTTIVSRQRSLARAAMTGVYWGIGHSLTVFVVGGAIVLFGLVVPERLGLGLEFCVAIMLVLLGVLNLARFLRRTHVAVASGSGNLATVEHSHPHSHGDYVHAHPHGHGSAGHGHSEERTPSNWLDSRFGNFHACHAARPVLIGVVHGLAGSAAVALLVLPIISDSVWAMGYLVIFGLGTVAGMMLMTGAIALPFLYAAGRSHGVHRWLGATTGALSLGFGVFLMFQIGWLDGLFRG